MIPFKALLLGFKNAFGNIKNEYSTNELWDIKNRIEKKFQKINYETYKNTKSRIKQFY